MLASITNLLTPKRRERPAARKQQDVMRTPAQHRFKSSNNGM